MSLQNRQPHPTKHLPTTSSSAIILSKIKRLIHQSSSGPTSTTSRLLVLLVLVSFSPSGATSTTFQTSLRSISPKRLSPPGKSSSRGSSDCFVSNKVNLVPSMSKTIMASSTRQEGKVAPITDTIFPNGSIPKTLPKLLVFDLDNTLWTPELYQIRTSRTPQANKDIRLFPDAEKVLSDLSQNPLWKADGGVKLGIASRTNKYAWAHSLLKQFSVNSEGATTTSLEELFPYRQIVKGSKLVHFENLQRETGVAFRDMIFFDDDANMNLREVERMGVFCVHCPVGIRVDLFRESLLKYGEMRGADRAVKVWMGMTVNSKSFGLTEANNNPIRKAVGRVKYYSDQKKFGFLTEDGTSGSSSGKKKNAKRDNEDIFFHESKIPAGMTVRIGMRVEFEVTEGANGKPAAAILASIDTDDTDISSSGGGKPASRDNATTDEKKVEMLCFSMSQPFAALLVNGIKTIESRNNPMFEDIKPGTKVLLHCGMRDWRDQEDYKVQLHKAGLSKDEINKYSILPKGFSKGSIIGILEIGKTWLTTPRERRGDNMQRRVVAKTENVGKYCTEIKSATWLHSGVKARGNAGIYSANIPKSAVVPDK